MKHIIDLATDALRIGSPYAYEILITKDGGWLKDHVAALLWLRGIGRG